MIPPTSLQLFVVLTHRLQGDFWGGSPRGGGGERCFQPGCQPPELHSLSLPPDLCVCVCPASQDVVYHDDRRVIRSERCVCVCVRNTYLLSPTKTPGLLMATWCDRGGRELLVNTRVCG